MIAQLLRVALRQRFLSVLVGAALIGAGVWSFTQLSIEAYPDISDTQVVVISLYPGHAAEEIEQQVSVPIERALNSVPNVIARRSRTIFGLSVVELTFEYGTNDYFARQVVLEKLRDAQLPDGVTPTLGPLSTPIGELYRYTLQGGGHDSRDLREIEDWVVEPRLLQVPGVTDITPFGGVIKQYQIDVDPLALTRYGLSIRDIAQAVDANNQNAGGALLDNGQQSMAVRGVGLIQSVDDIQNIVVSTTNDVPVYVRDIGRVQIGSAPRTGIFALGEKTDRVEGIVLMRRGENPTEVLAGVHEAVNELNRTGLPRGVRIVPIYDRTDLVNNTLHTVSHTLIEGLVIVVAVLFLFLGSVRAALLTAVTIPLSLLFAFVCMHFSGIPANLLSLGALDFGIIVDGTLVMVEHVMHALDTRRRRDPDALAGESVLDTIRDAALEVERPIFFSLVIIVSAYIPLFTLERVERRLFTPMAFTVCYALLGSMLLALTLIPVLATYLFRNAPKSWENPVVTWLHARYARLLEATIDRPWRVVGGAAAVVAAAFGVAALLGHRVSSAAGRGRAVDSCELPGWHLAGEISGACQPDSSAGQAVARSEAGHVADRPERRWDGSVRTESQRVLCRAHAVRDLGCGEAQGRPRRGAVGPASPADSRRVLQLHAADYRQRHRSGDGLAGGSCRHHHRPGSAGTAAAGPADAGGAEDHSRRR